MASVTFDPNTGVVTPSTQAIRDDLATAIQNALRRSPDEEPANVDSTSSLGQVIDLIVAEIEAKNAEIAFLANQYSPRISEGVFLDGIAALYGLTRHASEPTVVVCTCTGIKGTVIPYGAIVQDTEGTQLRCAEAGGVQIGENGTVDVRFSTVDHGAIEIGAHTVTKIVTVVAGWDAVDNASAGATGRDLEPDGELYHRMLQSYAINANSTVENIQSNLANLDGVLDVVVLENYTNEEQEQFSITLAPHSIAVCIVGGEDEDIARILWERKSAGCGVNGETTITYIDTEHFNAQYSYLIVRPTTEDFKVQITFFDAGLSEDIKTSIQQAVVSDFLGEGSNARVKLATTVYASRFYQCVQAVTDSPIKEILIGLGDEALSTSVDVPANVEPAISAENVSFVFGGGS